MQYYCIRIQAPEGSRWLKAHCQVERIFWLPLAQCRIVPSSSDLGDGIYLLSEEQLSEILFTADKKGWRSVAWPAKVEAVEVTIRVAEAIFKETLPQASS